jgi:adenylosuccinate synthase
MINFADVVIDLQAGDSGKGKISNALIQSGGYTHSVRFNGSNNAGHTIYVDGKKIVTHSIPAGVLHGVKSIIGPGCVVNVDHFFNELEDIRSAGINPDGLVYIATNTHIITESHLEEDGRDTKIGTTKRGNGPAYRDKYDRKGIRASEVHELQPYLIDVYEEFHGKKECSVLFEGAQGFYLDVDWGDYPYVTSSHCTVGSAAMNGVPPQKIRKVYGAAKIYETYVGTKKFEPDDPVFEKIRELGNEYGATTGRPRQCNWLNLDNLVKASKINGVTDLVISKMDIMRDLNIWCLYHRGEKIKFSLEMGMKHYILSQLDSDVTIYWSDNPEKL